MKIQDFQYNVTCGGFDNIFANIYKPQDIESQKSRYMSAVEKFTALYPNRNDIHVYSAPGRTEIGGNHTDQLSAKFILMQKANGTRYSNCNYGGETNIKRKWCCKSSRRWFRRDCSGICTK